MRRLLSPLRLDGPPLPGPVWQRACCKRESASTHRSRFGRAGALLSASLLLGAVALPACGASVERDAPTSDSGETPDTATSLTFVPSDTIALSPGESRTVNVVAGPPNHYTVRFALVPDGSDAEPNDASLDRSEAVTDGKGIASVTVTAPSTPTTLILRASIGDSVEDRLPISVSDKGFGTVVVEPHYAGTRDVEEWVASVRVGSACSDLKGFPPPDSALSGSASPKKSPRVESVPVGVMAAVSVRAGKFAYGCANLEDLQTDETRTVQIDVADRPMNLASGRLDLTLALDMSTDEWTSLLEKAIGSASDAFKGQATTDVELLLGEMSALLAQPDRADFDSRRDTSDFDAIVSNYLAPQGLRDAVSAWLAQGASDITQSGTLEGMLELDDASATFKLNSAGGVLTASSGFLGSSTWTAFADPADTLVLGGKLMFQATHWVAALAEAPALAEHESALSIPDALAEVVDCDALGADLASSGAYEIYDGCGDICAAKLCRQALVTAWTRVQNGGTELSTLSVGVTGAAEVDDEARPVSLEGMWVGSLGDGKTSVVGGAASGEPPSAE